MRTKLFLMSLLVMPLLAACGVSSYSLKTNYTPTTSIETSTDYDEVWNNVVDFFATNNLPISVLEKDSGLIAASNVNIAASFVTAEDKNGRPINPHAWFIMPYQKNFYMGKVTCSFNVRVKKTQSGTTHISINLGGITGYRCIKYFNALLLTETTEWEQSPTQCESTGRFESDLLNLFK